MCAEGSGDTLDQLKSKVRAFSIILLVALAVKIVFSFISDNVLGHIVGDFFEEVREAFPPESKAGGIGQDQLKRTVHPSFMAQFSHMFVALAVPVLGLYGVAQMQKALLNMFWMASATCGCFCLFCSACPSCCVVVLVSSNVGWALSLLHKCDMAKACPLDGPKEEVLDCAAASTWHAEYDRKYGYGEPLPEDLGCPPIWLNCTGDSGRTSTISADGARRLLAGWAQGSPPWERPAFALAGARALATSAGPAAVPFLALSGLGGAAPLNVSRGVPTAWRGETAQPRRLALAGDGDEFEEDSRGDVLEPPPMPESVMDECKTQADLIRILPLAQDFLQDSWPTVRTLMLVSVMISNFVAAAFGAGASAGKRLAETMSEDSDEEFAGMPGPAPLVRGQALVVQGTVLGPPGPARSHGQPGYRGVPY